MYVFIQKIIEVKDEVIDKMKKNKEFIFNANNRRDFNTATKCFICRKDFQQGDRGLETIATLQRDKGMCPRWLYVTICYALLRNSSFPS